ncbi:MAG: nucleotidyltransferase domain-containing protein [Pseudomonadota bacterium]
MLCSVFRRHAYVEQVVLFGSRAKGTARYNSDIDLAVEGVLNDLQIEALAMELDDLPLAYQFDVKALSSVRSAPLKRHIERVGRVIYERDIE